MGHTQIKQIFSLPMNSVVNYGNLLAFYTLDKVPPQNLISKRRYNYFISISIRDVWNARLTIVTRNYTLFSYRTISLHLQQRIFKYKIKSSLQEKIQLYIFHTSSYYHMCLIMTAYTSQ